MVDQCLQGGQILPSMTTDLTGLQWEVTRQQSTGATHSQHAALLSHFCVTVAKEVLNSHRKEAAGLGILLRPAVFRPQEKESATTAIVEATATQQQDESGGGDLTSLDTLFLRTCEGAQGVFQVHRVSRLPY